MSCPFSSLIQALVHYHHGSTDGAGAVAESYILIHGTRQTLVLEWNLEASKSTPTWPHLLILLILSKTSTTWIFLTLDTFSFKFDGAVIMPLTSSLERRRVMPLRSDASGTLQVGWQDYFPGCEVMTFYRE
ncbi:mCG140970, isoform CRA_b [Mus musculus]|uniref:Uncharacterized protein n=1 Tax=Mus musculus TaxID=10090 RepID=Q3V0W3_MOUSE|nr:mCG140970, isoform CRA_b [Mus musculus]BAE21390.1 unnamed protein product [Mus musculus]|eukprot:XP_003085187.1 PREDICTED: uncharacterized protein Nudt12os [Mus musculus]